MGPTKEYCYFEVIARKKKTVVYGVYALSDDLLLGKIAWYWAWRQYCFFPEADTVWSRNCWNQVDKFILKLMNERK